MTAKSEVKVSCIYGTNHLGDEFLRGYCQAYSKKQEEPLSVLGGTPLTTEGVANSLFPFLVFFYDSLLESRTFEFGCAEAIHLCMLIDDTIRHHAYNMTSFEKVSSFESKEGVVTTITLGRGKEYKLGQKRFDLGIKMSREHQDNPKTTTAYVEVFGLSTESLIKISNLIIQGLNHSIKESVSAKKIIELKKLGEYTVNTSLEEPFILENKTSSPRSFIIKETWLQDLSSQLLETLKGKRFLLDSFKSDISKEYDDTTCIVIPGSYRVVIFTERNSKMYKRVTKIGLQSIAFCYLEEDLNKQTHLEILDAIDKTLTLIKEGYFIRMAQ